MEIPPGLSPHSRLFLQYLPEYYHTDFMSRFLAIFESIFIPIQWQVDNFDLYLDPNTIPGELLPWMLNLYGFLLDDAWTETQKRQLLQEAPQLFDRRGTKWALQRILEIFTGAPPQIDDESQNLPPHTFTIYLPLSEDTVNKPLIQRLINAHKPAHTTYQLSFQE